MNATELPSKAKNTALNKDAPAPATYGRRGSSPNTLSSHLERMPATHSVDSFWESFFGGGVPQDSRVTPRPPRDFKVAVLGAIRALRHAPPKNDSQNESPLCVAGMCSHVTCLNVALCEPDERGSTRRVAVRNHLQKCQTMARQSTTDSHAKKQQPAGMPSNARAPAPTRGLVPWCRSARPLAVCVGVLLCCTSYC